MLGSISMLGEHTSEFPMEMHAWHGMISMAEPYGSGPIAGPILRLWPCTLLWACCVLLHSASIAVFPHWILCVFILVISPPFRLGCRIGQVRGLCLECPPYGLYWLSPFLSFNIIGEILHSAYMLVIGPKGPYPCVCLQCTFFVLRCLHSVCVPHFHDH